MVQRVPVEGEYLDDDGVPVWILLHVSGGVLKELEICRADGLQIISPPNPERITPVTIDYDAMIKKAQAARNRPKQT